MQNSAISIIELTPTHFKDVIDLGNLVHGNGYLSQSSLTHIFEISILNNINASFVAYQNQQLIGFRLTYAPGRWPIDEWCTPNKWHHKPQNICYFKCNTVSANHRGQGIGTQLLKASIQQAKKQGCTAGLAHIWMESPGNSAYIYMSRAGAKLIKKHPNRWYEDSVSGGYNCIYCGHNCQCTAAEMLIEFHE